MNLATGRKIHGFKFTELAIPPHVIDRVHELADAEGSQNLDHDGCPNFEWEFDEPIEFEEELNNEVHSINPVEDDNSQSVLQNDVDDESISAAVTSDFNDESISSEDDSDYSHISESRSENVEESSIISDAINEDIEEENIDNNENVEEETISNNAPTQEIRSAIDPQNIIETPRERKEARHVNVDSFPNKSYDVSLFNISEEDFEKFERVKNDLYSSTIGTCFTQ